MPYAKSSLVLALGVLAVLSAGCVQTLAPSQTLDQHSLPHSMSQESALFYPLDIGNHWGYEIHETVQITPVGGVPGEPIVFESQFDVDVVGTAERFGRTYLVQRESDPASTYTSDFLYRQDKSGLFNADPEPTNVTASAARVAAIVDRVARGATPAVKAAYQAALNRALARQAVMRRAAFGQAEGPLAGEIALLLYPLGSGKTWHVREDPLFVYTVEAQDAVDLPAGKFNGWRIRIESDLFGPEDQVRVWYGRDGLLQLSLYAEGEVTDENGNLIGTFVTDWVQRLSEVSLVKKNPS